jgi:hypothetical protein
LYAYSRGISSAGELAGQSEFEPGLQWLCGLEAVSHRTLSGFGSDNKVALDDLFVQVLGTLTAEGLIPLERVTLDGTKIKANAGGNSFRRKEKLKAHLKMRPVSPMLSRFFHYKIFVMNISGGIPRVEVGKLMILDILINRGGRWGWLKDKLTTYFVGMVCCAKITLPVPLQPFDSGNNSARSS